MAVLRYDFHSHPKILGLPNAAVGVFARALSYASGNLTDGYIPAKQWHQWDEKRANFERLFSAGLAEQVPGGYRIIGYLEHNPSKKEVEAKRAEARERMRRVRKNKPRQQPAPPPVRSREQGPPVRMFVRDIGQEQGQSQEQGQHPSTDRSLDEPQEDARDRWPDVAGWTRPDAIDIGPAYDDELEPDDATRP